MSLFKKQTHILKNYYKAFKKLTGLLFVAIENIYDKGIDLQTIRYKNISVSAEEKLKEDKKLRKNNHLILVKNKKGIISLKMTWVYFWKADVLCCTKTVFYFYHLQILQIFIS